MQPVVEAAARLVLEDPLALGLEETLNRRTRIAIRTATVVDTHDTRTDSTGVRARSHTTDHTRSADASTRFVLDHERHQAAGRRCRHTASTVEPHSRPSPITVRGEFPAPSAASSRATASPEEKAGRDQRQPSAGRSAAASANAPILVCS